MISRELAALAQDCTINMTDVQVMEQTGLSRPTWRRLWRGEVISDTLILRFAAGLHRDPKPFLEAARQVRTGLSDDRLVAYALGQTDVLTQDDRVEIMEHYRRLVRLRQANGEQSNAA